MFVAPNICGMNSERLQFSVNLLCLCCHSINCFLVSSLTKLQKLDLTFLLICKAPTALTSAPLLFRQGNVAFSLNISISTLCTLHSVHLISSVACYNCDHSIWFDLLWTSHVTGCFPSEWRLSNAFGNLNDSQFHEVSFNSQIWHLWYVKILLSRSLSDGASIAINYI